MMLALVVLVIAVVAIAAIVLADRYQYRVLRYKKYRRELPRRLRKSLDYLEPATRDERAAFQRRLDGRA